MKQLIVLFILALTLTANAQNEKITGVWWNLEKSARTEIFEQNGKIYGKIVWLKNDVNPDGTAPRKDFNNPEAKLKTRKLVGVQILKNLEWDADDNEWDDGEIYDPKSGKTYKCYAVLQKDGRLMVKGHISGMPFLGSSTYWTRYNP